MNIYRYFLDTDGTDDADLYEPVRIKCFTIKNRIDRRIKRIWVFSLTVREFVLGNKKP